MGKIELILLQLQSADMFSKHIPMILCLKTTLSRSSRAPLIENCGVRVMSKHAHFFFPHKIGPQLHVIFLCNLKDYGKFFRCQLEERVPFDLLHQAVHAIKQLKWFIYSRPVCCGFVRLLMSNLPCSVGIFNKCHLMNETQCVVSH